jgi:hypothetical protein
MSDKLTELLDELREAYLKEMEANGHSYPFKTAHQLTHRRLALPAEELVELITSAPRLLASRAGDLIESEEEGANPTIGAIISANLVAAGMDGLMMVATKRNWLERDEHGDLLVDAHELDLCKLVLGVDYTKTPKEFVPQSGRSQLSDLFAAAETAFEKALCTEAMDAYQLSLKIASDYAVFAPDDLAPLLAENPLMLGLRNDGLVDPELFNQDPPAGMILSAHLTEMMVAQMVDHAIEKGAIGMDSEGQPLFVDDEEPPTLH